VRKGSISKENWSTSGNGGDVVSNYAAGLDYDPVVDKIVGWNGSSVYALNPETKTWSTHAGSGAPARNGTGTFGSWRYVPSVNAYILLTGAKKNVYFYKLTSGSGLVSSEGSGKPNPRLQLLAQPNPFVGKTTLRIDGRNLRGPLVVEIFSSAGKRIYKKTRTQVSKAQSLVWNARHLPSGLYLVRVQVGGRVLTKRIILMK